MKELYVSGNSKTIWDELRTKFNKMHSENDDVKIKLSISDGKNVDSLKSLDTFFNELEYGNVTFELVYNYYLTDNKESGWFDFASRMREKMLGQVKDIGKGLVKAIVKIIFNFEVSTIDYNNIEILSRIKNLSPETKDRFEVNLLIKNSSHSIVIKVPSNDRSGWVTAHNLLKTIKCLIFNNSIINITFNVMLNAKNDATNLRYYLPLWHHYKDIFKLSLDIFSYDEDLGYRVLQFLNLVKVNYRVKIINSEKELNGKKNDDASDILPMIPFEQDKTEDYVRVINSINANYEKYLSILSNYEGEKGKYVISSSPDEENKIRSKSQIRDKLIAKVNELTSNSKEFEKLIFLFFIRYLLREKEIFVYEQCENTTKQRVDLNYNLIDSVWFNSKTYAEGIWQIIENAQIHSQGHVAFYGMRIYKADPAISIGELSKEATTRYRLWRKYWYDNRSIREEIKSTKGINSENKLSIFNCGRDDGYDRFPNFIEFYVLDDALGSDCSALGIVNKIKHSASFKKEISSIETIFKLTENDYKEEIDKTYKLSYRLTFYIQHYGMRWLQQHVNNLHGIMEIYSPYSKEVSENKGEISDNNKARVYSNIFSDVYKVAKDGELVLQNLYSTEYSILIPLKYNQ